MPGFKKKDSERHSPYATQWMDVYEERVLEYFKKKCRSTGRSLLTFQEVATDLKIHRLTAKRYIRRLCDAGRLRRERHKHLGGIFEVPGLKARSASKKRSLLPWDLDSTKAVFEELRKKCAAAGGKWSGTHQMLAEGVKLHPGTTISRITRELHARGLIIKHRHGNWSDYTIVGQAVTNNRPSPMSAEGKVLKFIEDECARTGLLSCKQSDITKATGVWQKTISDNIGTLAADGHIKIIRHGRPHVCSVPGVVGAFPGEPPAFSIEEAILKFLRDEMGSNTRALSYRAIGKGAGCGGETVRNKLPNLVRNGLVLVTQRGVRRGGLRRPDTYAAAAFGSNKELWTQPEFEAVVRVPTAGSERKALFARMRAKTKMSYQEFEDFADVKSEQLRDWLRWRPGKRAYKDGSDLDLKIRATIQILLEG